MKSDLHARLLAKRQQKEITQESHNNHIIDEKSEEEAEIKIIEEKIAALKKDNEV